MTITFILILAILVGVIPLITGWLWTRKAVGKNGWFTEARKTHPTYIPPGWVFGLVWFTLYILLGYSSYFIFDQLYNNPRGNLEILATAFFCFNWLFNLLWPLIFFTFQKYNLACVVLGIVLITAVGVLAPEASLAITSAEYIILATFVAYIFWLMYAFTLNWSFFTIAPGTPSTLVGQCQSCQ